MSATPKIKLTYFDIEGRGECVRLALTLAKIPFEDERIKGPQWQELKPKTPGGQLPVLTIDDGPMRTQSMAIVRWIGATYSKTLYPQDKIFDIEEAIGVLEDLEKAWVPAFYMGMRASKFGHPEDFGKTEEGQKVVKELREKFVKDELPVFLKRMSDMMAAHGGKWLVAGDEPTVADCCVVPVLRSFTRGHIDHVPTNCLDINPAIVQYIKNFCALDGVKGRYNNGIY